MELIEGIMRGDRESPTGENIEGRVLVGVMQLNLCGEDNHQDQQHS